jgi:hypothetical protein
VTKTNPKTTKTLTAAELSRQALADAQAQVAIRRDQHTKAVTAAEELVTRLTSGDDTPTSAELGNSHNEVERAGYLLTAAETQVKRAERALINDDLTLAELMADVLADVFDGEVPVKVTGVPGEAQPNPDGSAVVFIVQPKAATKRGGIVSGLLDVVFYRPRRFAPLNGHEVETKSRARGFEVQPNQVSEAPAGDGRRDDLRLTVNRAFLPVPELSQAPTDAAVHEFGRDVNGELMQAVVTGQERVTYMNQHTPGKASADLVSHRLVSSLPMDNGTVRVTIETTSKVKPESGLPAHFANERLRQAIGRHVEQVAPGVGRIVSAQAVAVEMPDPAGPRSAQPWEVTARFDLTYRLT